MLQGLLVVHQLFERLAATKRVQFVPIPSMHRVLPVQGLYTAGNTSWGANSLAHASF